MLELWSRARSAAASTPDTRDALDALRSLDPGALVVARDPDGTLAGVVIAGWDGWRAVIHRLAVEPAARRRGVATALVRAAEARFSALGAGKVSILVGAGEDDVREFWRRIGYADDLEVVRHVGPLGPLGPAP